MMGTSHFASGILTSSLVALAGELPPASAVVFIAVTAVCSLLPDFDHPDAMLPRMFGWPGRALAAVISGLFGHRTLTHSFLGMGLLTLGMAFIPGLPLYVAGAVLLGCATHILGDMLTISGVPLFWPHGRDFRIGWMRTDGHFETLVMRPLLTIAAVASLGLVVAVNT